MKKLFFCLLFLTACTQTPAPTRTLPPIQVTRVTVTPPASTVTPTTSSPAATTALATPLPPTTLTITAPDGAPLVASFYPPVPSARGAGDASRAPGVLLLHMYGASRADWVAFALHLQERGTAALALDLRGHGASPGPTNWSQALLDVRAAWETLMARPEVDAQHSAIIGASVGANLALMLGANNPNVVTVVALSPGLNYVQLQPALVMRTFGARPVLLVASQDDSYAYTSAQQLAALAPSAETYFFKQAGHGMAMFNDPALEPLLLDWLQKYVGLRKG